MLKLIASVLFTLILFKISDPNLYNVFNFSDRYLMRIYPKYTETYLNNKWNNDLNKLDSLDLSYNFVQRVNNITLSYEYNKTNESKYTLLLEGKKYRVSTVLEMNNNIKKYYSIYRKLKYHTLRYQTIATYLVDQLPSKYVIYKIGIVKKGNKSGILVAGIEKNMAYVLRLIRPKLKAIKFTNKELGIDGVEFNLNNNLLNDYKFNSWIFEEEFTVDSLK